MRVIVVGAFVMVMGLVGGCAVDSRAGFEEVRRGVLERTGQRVVWSTGGAADVAVRGKIAELLGGELTLEQAVGVALLNNAELQGEFEELGIAQADLVQAGLLKNPVISARVGFPGRPHYPVDLGVEGEFLDLVFLPLRKKVAAASFAEAKARVVGAVVKHAGEVRVGFYRLQGAMQSVELRRVVVAAMAANVEFSRRLREAGNIPELNLASDMGMLAQAKVELAEGELEVLELREEMNGLMGVSGAGTWRVAGRLPEVGGEMRLEGLEGLAISQREDLAALKHAAEGAGRMAGIANVAAMLSGAAAGASYQRDPDVTGTLGPTISATVPIFDQGQAAGARAGAVFRQAEHRYRAMVVKIQGEVRKAYGRMAAARERAMFYKGTVIPLRTKITAETQLQYNGMFVGLPVLLGAKREEVEAGVKYVEALRDYWVGRSELEMAVGSRLVEPGAVTGAVETMPAGARVEHTH